MPRVCNDPNKPAIFAKITSWNENDMVMRLWYSKQSKWIEVRGTYGKDGYSLFQQVIDAMPGWHTSVLFSGDTLSVCSWHPDYDYLANLINRES